MSKDSMSIVQIQCAFSGSACQNHSAHCLKVGTPGMKFCSRGLDVCYKPDHKPTLYLYQAQGNTAKPWLHWSWLDQLLDLYKLNME